MGLKGTQHGDHSTYSSIRLYTISFENAFNESSARNINLDDINAGDVPEGLGDSLVLVIDDEGAQLLDMATVPQLTLAGAHAAGGVNPEN